MRVQIGKAGSPGGTPCAARRQGRVGDDRPPRTYYQQRRHFSVRPRRVIGRDTVSRPELDSGVVAIASERGEAAVDALEILGCANEELMAVAPNSVELCRWAEADMQPPASHPPSAKRGSPSIEPRQRSIQPDPTVCGAPSGPGSAAPVVTGWVVRALVDRHVWCCQNRCCRSPWVGDPWVFIQPGVSMKRYIAGSAQAAWDASSAAPLGTQRRFHVTA